MKKINENEFIWAEKYRPQILDDIILPQETKKVIRKWIEDQEIPSVAFIGNIPGSGKTTLANLIKNEIECDYLYINASDERSIDTFRYKVTDFASKMPIKGKIRMVELAEMDNLLLDSQKILREIIERFSKYTRFVATLNYKDKLIPPLLQRFQEFNLDEIFAKNKKEVAKEMYKRLEFICKNENVKYTQEDLLKIIKAYYPSMREMIMNLQKSVVDGKLVVKNLSIRNEEFVELMELVKSKDFKKVREKLNDIVNIENLYTFLYNHLDEYFDVKDQAQVIVEIATYQDYNYRAMNKTIPAMSLLVKIWNLIKR